MAKSWSSKSKTKVRPKKSVVTPKPKTGKKK